MKGKDLYQLSDRDLIAELRVMQSAITGNEAEYGLSIGDSATLSANIDNYEAKVDSLDAKRAEVAEAKGGRDAGRAVTVENAALAMKKIRLHVGNEPAKLGAVNLDSYDTTQSAAPAPATIPLASIDYGILKHTIKFRDAATPNKRGKPAGMLGAEIWAKVGGPAPVSDSDYSMVTLVTASPYVIFYSMGDAGKPVWYRLRWVSKSGKKGGWSETVVGTVNG